MPCVNVTDTVIHCHAGCAQKSEVITCSHFKMVVCFPLKGLCTQETQNVHNTVKAYPFNKFLHQNLKCFPRVAVHW